MKTKRLSWRVYSTQLVAGQFLEMPQPERTNTSTFPAWRAVLEKAACRLLGREGRDWRMVQDDTLIGFHVRDVRTGETLELRPA